MELSSLTHLRKLDLSFNNLSEGLPEVVCQLPSLNTLTLFDCKLVDLPSQLRNLKQLTEMDLEENEFTDLPSVVYQLKSLKTLYLYHNRKLERIDEAILQLTNLTILDCDRCESLKYPPYSVSMQGISAVRGYFTSLAETGALQLTDAPVATLGCSLSGKTSLMLSLQLLERVLTYRNESSILDETTKMFNIGELHVNGMTVRFIDYGGHEVYHHAYVLAQKTRSIPLIVVNMEEFVDLSETRGPKEAARRVLFDWISHFYLSCPQLGSPLLALTHTDQVTSPLAQHREDLLQAAQLIREELVEEDKQLASDPKKGLRSIAYLSNTTLPLFNPEDIFEFSNNLDEKSNINMLRKKIEERCKEFTFTIPESWNRVESSINSREDVCIAVSDLKQEDGVKDLLVILRYMHNSGKIFWFEDIKELSGFIFPKVSAIADLITLLFHHSSEKEWKERLGKFSNYLYKRRKISKQEYKRMVDEFTKRGVLEDALLFDLLKSSKFSPDLSLILLKSFHILHGPLDWGRQTVYLVPALSQQFMGNEWKTEGVLQLRADLVFSGLSPPKYVYHQMCVMVTKSTASLGSKEFVRQNGATIQLESQAVHVVHDFNMRKVTLQVATPVDHLAESWKVLIETIARIGNFIKRVWRASQIEVHIFCAHCLFCQLPKPSHVQDPGWLYHNGVINVDKIQTYPGLGLVACDQCTFIGGRPKPEVPRPLVLPCDQLTNDEVVILEEYLSRIQPGHCSQTAARETMENEESADAVSDADSDISDVEEEKYWDESREAEINMELVPVRKSRIKRLYYNTTKVYGMSDNCRGRVLIINIKNFTDGEVRHGSEIDYLNVCNLFTALSFKIAKSERDLTDLTSEQICEEIREETQREEHHVYGMFVLVIMSHGHLGNVIFDRDRKPVTLKQIQDLLSPRRFEAMKGKPKLIIVQACSGEEIDYGDAKDPVRLSTSSSSTANQPSTSSDTTDLSPPPQPSATPGLTLSSRKPGSRITRDTVFNADDFFIMKASSESYLATRSNSHGSWFIRVLVATFYKHACHRDVESLFRIIQERVRLVSKIDRSTRTKDYQGGNVPTSSCTFTNYRKLLLFPGMRTTRQQ